MPSPYETQRSAQQQMSSVLRDFFEQPADASLAHEVAALRQEIAALRAELKPVSSLILTGQQVAAEFKRLNTNPKGRA
jgi:hypothetical protein